MFGWFGGLAHGQVSSVFRRDCGGAGCCLEMTVTGRPWLSLVVRDIVSVPRGSE